MRATPVPVLLLLVGLCGPAMAQAPMETGGRLDAPPWPGGAPVESPSVESPPAGAQPNVPPGYGAEPPSTDATEAAPEYPTPTPVAVQQAPEQPAPPVRKNVITGDLFAQAIHYERAVAERISIFAGVRVFAFSFDPGGYDLTSFGVGPEVGVRIFVTGTAPGGFFVAPEVGVGAALDDSSSGLQSGPGWWAGGLAGYTWLFSGGFVLSLGIGGQYYDLQLPTVDGPAGPKRGDLLARLGLGWSF